MRHALHWAAIPECLALNAERRSESLIPNARTEICQFGCLRGDLNLQRVGLQPK